MKSRREYRKLSGMEAKNENSLYLTILSYISLLPALIAYPPLIILLLKENIS
jgi:hypothetical protein